jgi:hypothetical protein
MKFRIALIVFAILVALASVPIAAMSDDSAKSLNIPDRDRGPSFSAPQERILSNGDVPSHYPPYFHPEGDGGR